MQTSIDDRLEIVEGEPCEALRCEAIEIHRSEEHTSELQSP